MADKKRKQVSVKMDTYVSLLFVKSDMESTNKRVMSFSDIIDELISGYLEKHDGDKGGRRKKRV